MGYIRVWVKEEEDLIRNNLDKYDEELTWIFRTNGFCRSKGAIEKKRLKLGYPKRRGSRKTKQDILGEKIGYQKQYHVKWASLQLHV